MSPLTAAGAPRTCTPEGGDEGGEIAAATALKHVGEHVAARGAAERRRRRWRRRLCVPTVLRVLRLNERWHLRGVSRPLLRRWCPLRLRGDNRRLPLSLRRRRNWSRSRGRRREVLVDFI